MRKILLLLILAIITSNSYSQEYLELMQKENVNFYEVQKSAQKYFANRDKGRGSGYKHYKRWEYIHQKEIDDQGYIIKPEQVWQEQDLFLRNYQNSQAHQKKGPNKSLTGNWTSLGPYDWQRTSGWNPGVGRLVCIDVDESNQNLIYVGSPTGGLWKTIDGGNTWQVLTDSFPVMDIWSVEIDPINSNIVYMGTAGGGILKTSDGGQTWNQTGSIGGTIRDILIHPTNNNIVFAARTSSFSGAVYRSTNGGGTWTQVSSVNAEDLRFKPGDPNTVYACGNDFQRSTDGGLNWTTITSGITASERMKMDVSPANPNYVYLIQKSGSIFGRVYRSTDSGLNFTIREQYDGSTNNYLGYSSNGTDTRGQAGRDMAITVSNTNAEEIIIAGIILFRSSDGGDNYTPLTEWFLPNSLGYVHADVEVLDYVGANLFSGSDGGIYKSTDNGSNFTDLTAGLGIRQFYRIGCSQLDPNVVSGGSQDNGTSVMRGVSRDWVDWLGADGMETFVDHSNANILYGTSQYGSMYKSTNQGNSRTGIAKPTGVGNGSWVTPFEIDPAVSTTIYVGFDRLYKNTSGTGPASNWNAISPGTIGSGNMDELCLAPSDANTIYMSYTDQLYRTTDGGSNWSNITEPWSGFINYISVDPNNSQRVAVAVSGGNKIYISNDGGNNWTNLTLNLPNIGANCVLLDASAENGIYVGMQSGIYYKDDLLSSWIPFLTDLPRVRVLELEIVSSVGKIRAATYGRGLWESDVYSGNNGNLPPVAEFSANTTSAIVSAPISFLDNSLGSPNSWTWSFPGGTPSSSGIQNPVVSYGATGTYDVSLLVTNANGSDSISKTSFITITNYCIPDPSTGTSDGDYIDGVVLGNINNQNTGSSTGPSYNDYTNLSTDIARNSNQTVNITSGSYTTDHYAVWIDFNQDNDFDDPGEKLGEVQSTLPFQSLNIPFTVPLTAQLDTTTMRVRCVYNGLNMDPCTDYTWGETEDYSVVITSAVACTPTFTVGTSDGDFIDGVEFGTMSNTGTGSATGPDFNDYGSISCQVNKLDSVYLKITSGSYFTDYYAAWIDWNNNGDYTDPGEKIGEFQSSSAFETDSFLVNIAMNVNTGFYGMRIRCSYNSPNMSPCSQYTWGETEDYQIEVLPSNDICVLPNTPTANNDSVCDSGIMNLAVLGTANSFNWYTDLSNDTLFNTGNTYTTPFLTNTETYYVAASNEQMGLTQNTWFNSNNGSSGNLFDIFSAKNIRIDGFSVNLTGTVQKEVAVYYKVGSYEGFETNPAAWTLLGVDTVLPAGQDIPTYVDVGGLVINQEQTYGILVHTNQGGIRYTNLSADSTLMNDDFSITMGKGMGGIFNQVFSPRAFNGTIHYTKYAGCESQRIPVIAKVNPNPQVQISSAGPYCIDENSTILSANPSGGLFSGAASASGVFDPQSAGVGFHDVYYDYTDMSACSNADTISIEVKALPNVTLNSFSAVCENDPQITLSGGSPTGGTYSGLGINNGVFDPSISGSGTFNISYSYTDNFGCSNSDVQSITVNSKPAVSFNDNLDYCEGDPITNLSGGSPTGGQYFGNGVSANQFDPVSAGIGNHLVSYSYQNSNGCSDTASLNFSVNAKPNVTHNNVQDLCEDDGVLALSGASPSGGIYSGTAISGNNFDPQISGIGVFGITYSYTDINGCFDSVQFSISVNALPTVNLSGIPNLCESDNPIVLSGGSPSGGLYSGPGVNNGILDPAIVGSGVIAISYDYTDASGCTNSASQNITITAKPNVTFNTSTNFCEGDPVVNLSGGQPVGGTYLGNGVSGSTFNPISAGTGTHLIQYAFQDINGCSDTASLNFNVYSKPNLSHSAIADVCSDAGSFALSGGTPSGGVYSGVGVSSNSFDPQLSGVGNHPIYYSYTDNNGCSDSLMVNVQVNALPTVTLQNFQDICENESAVLLTGGNPVGGIYSGTGVNNGQFDPSLSGTGVFNITYNFTDINACSNSETKSITVNSAPQAGLSLSNAICENEGLLVLNGGSPGGGVYSGPGVSSNTFDPIQTGIGLHTLSYILTNANSCSDTATASIQVNSAPSITHSTVQDLCINDSAITLSGANPSGGTYFGVGISGNQFDPQIAGIGAHTVYYTFSNTNNCSDTISLGINVLSSPAVSISPVPDICENASALQLSATPTGGVFSGTGVNGSLFDPAISGTGSFVITYSFTNTAGCSGIDYDTITVYSSPLVTLDSFNSICQNDIAFALSGGLPIGGLYSGTGVSNGIFDPSVAGVGTHQITYMYTDANLCVAQAFENIEVKLSPLANFGYTVSGQTGNFSDSSVNANDWLWNFDDGNTSTSQNPVHTYASSGNYNVCLTVNNNGCSDQYCELLTIITNLNSSLFDDNFQFFPNPFESTLNYKINLEKGGLFRFDLLDIRSVIVKSYELNLEKGENSGRIDLQGLGTGTYLLNISNQDSRKTIKVEKIK
ncbi:MAG: GEVED domain-containing protein [Cytophagales bacterium]